MKKAIINNHKDDEHCFGYALLSFPEREQLPEINCRQVTLYTNEMFQRNHLDTLPYPNAANDVHLNEDKLQININVFSFFDDEGRARDPMMISRRNYQR